MGLGGPEGEKPAVCFTEFSAHACHKCLYLARAENACTLSPNDSRDVGWVWGQTHGQVVFNPLFWRVALALRVDWGPDFMKLTNR